MTARHLASRLLLALIAIGATNTPPTADAQSSRPVTISITYTMIHDLLHPNPAPNVAVNHSATFVLSGRNAVSESWQRSRQHTCDSSSSTGTLGGPGGHYHWRIASQSTLIRTSDFPQSTLTITIRVSGKTCNVQINATLKPGFSEFLYTGFNNVGVYYFGPPRFTNVSCSIQ